MASIIKRKYKATLPDGSVVVKQCEIYTIEYTGADGRRHREKGYSDRKATEQKAARLEKAIARGAEGLEDPFAQHKARQLSEHLKDYIASLKTGGLDEMYIYTMERRLNRLIKECAWESLRDIEPNSFIKWRDAEKNDKEGRKARLGQGASAATLNQYLDSIKAFTNWCASVNRMPGVPVPRRGKGRREGGMMALALSSVGKIDGEKRRRRRALSETEITALLTNAPADRVIIYRLGLSTGLRRQEIADLLWGDVRLNAIKPYLALRAVATKARRDDKVPLPQTLADALRKQRDAANAKDGDKVFPTGVPCMETWRADLKAASITEADGMGRKADFHGGMRKSFNTRLSKSGLGLVSRMRLMRVTDPKLVNDTYHDDDQLGLDDAAIAEILPETTAKPSTATSA